MGHFRASWLAWKTKPAFTIRPCSFLRRHVRTSKGELGSRRIWNTFNLNRESSSFYGPVSVVQSDVWHKDILVTSLVFWDYSYTILSFPFFLTSPPICPSFPSFEFLDSLLMNWCQMHLCTLIYTLLNTSCIWPFTSLHLSCLSRSSLCSQTGPSGSASSVSPLSWFYFVCACEHEFVHMCQPSQESQGRMLGALCYHSPPYSLEPGSLTEPRHRLMARKPKRFYPDPQSRVTGTWDYTWIFFYRFGHLESGP